jgi:hypothetical protein
MRRRAIPAPAFRLIVAIATIVVLASVASPAVGATSRRGTKPSSADAVFDVGAAAVDVTPPLASSGAPNPAAACATPAQLAQYDGPHLLSLEEPYIDSNHNGVWDSGEPFIDCPTPLANGGTAPPDGRWDGIMLGGGDGGPREPTAVLDELWARTIVVRSGHTTVSLTSVDNEGVFEEIWDQVRAKVHADGVNSIGNMLFSSTHDESAPDTIGISGPNLFASGVDPFYVQFLVDQTAKSIEQAAARLQPAHLRYGMIHPDNLVTCWSSYPFVADEDIGALQAHAVHGKKVIFTLANYGIHAEELGFSSNSQDALHLSSDWHNFARKALEAEYGGMAITVAGAVGSVEMPQVYPAARSYEPVGVYSSTGNGGCRTIYVTDSTAVPYGYTLSTEARGEQVAYWTEQALLQGADSTRGGIDIATKRFFVPLDNALFGIASQIGVIAGKTAYLNGVVVPRDATGAEIGGPGNEFQSDVFWLRIGDGGFASAPGELFPYTYIHSSAGPDDEATPDPTWSPPPWIMAMMNTRWRFVVGLADDMIGYMFPRTNAVGVPSTSDLNPPDVDRFGCGHSDDGEAAAVGAGDLVANEVASLMPAPRDQIVVGRYVWPDGTLHRSPIGEGGQACSGPGNTFVPAPGNGAVAVQIGTHRMKVDGHHLRWMDATGQPQSGPSTQTRGVIDRAGHRWWIDVFPDVS